MDTKSIDRPELLPSATPTPEEIAEWQKLDRDEQVRRMKLALSHPDTDEEDELTMDDVRARGRELAAKS